jgi:phasin
MNNPKNKTRNDTTKAALQFQEGVEKATAAAAEGTGAFKNSMSTAFKGVQDYNAKLLEFAHANTKSAFDFFQQLPGVKSPTELLELSTEHARTQFETLVEQTKQLASLAKSATVAAAEPIKAGGAKAFDHATAQSR